LTAPSGSTVPLSQAERQVMALLMASRGAPVSREVLIAHLTGDVEAFDPHRLEMLVFRLRQKCRQACGQDLPLRTVRGAGYLLEP
jgi:DNA-binding response OmpR family regulator